MSLRKKAASGAKWSSLSSAVNAGLNIVQLGILAHLLSPEDFGLMSMIMVVIGFADAYMDMGISNAIIQKQDSTSRELSSLYWTNLAAGAAVFIVVTLSTPLIADFYNENRLNDLLVWASLLFLITPLGQQFRILLQKKLRFKLLAIIMISGSLTGTIVAIISAILGQGVYSLIWGQLANAGIRTFLFIYIGYSEWPPTFHFKFEDLKGYIGFGVYQMGEKTLNYVERNLDYILIGRYLGPEILGAYSIAYQLVLKPIQKITPVLTKVAFPVFSKRQNNNASLRRGYLEICKMLTLIIYPLLIGLAVVAPVALPIFLGEGWGLTVVLTQILVGVGLARSLRSTSGVLYLAKGRADIGFKFNLAVALINLGVFWFAVQQGVITLALAAAGLNIAYFLVLQSIIKRLIGLKWKNLWMTLNTQLLMTAVMAIVVYGLYTVLNPVVDQKLLLVVLISTGATIYMGGILLLEKEFVKEIRAMVMNKVTAS